MTNSTITSEIWNLASALRDDGVGYEDYFKGEIAEKTARNDLSKLVDAGFLIMTGKGPLTQYKRTEMQLPDITGSKN